MKKVISILLAVVMLCSTFAGLQITSAAANLPSSGKCGENVTYTFDAGTGLLTISGSGGMKDYYGGSPFYSQTGIKTVVIESGVTSIGSGAFWCCSSLTSITIPNSVTSIGGYAFKKCSSLTSITIPDSVTSISGSAFYGCSGLTSITIPDSVTSIGGYAFKNCSGLTSVTIGNSVTSIGSGAFWCCSSLTSITIPNSVTSIGSDAFWCCRSLTSITIPNSVTSIGGSVFYGCSSLTSVTIPDSVTSIGEYAFYGCSNLGIVNISSIEAWCKISFDVGYANPLYYAHNLYLNNELITDLVIPNSVTSIGRSAFSSCSGLASVTIPDSVTCIGDSAFRDCSGLTSITIPDSVTSIGDSAFSGCSGLTDITIPDSVTSISEYAFYGCSSLTSITIPNSVTSIGGSVFYYCSSLTSIIVDKNNKVYDSRDNCNAIIETSTNTLVAGCKNTVIPNSVTSIGGYAFFGCSGLTGITIPDSVTSIGERAFSGCSGLTSIEIPSSVKSLGYYCFGNSGISKVYISDLAAWCNMSYPVSRVEGTLLNGDYTTLDVSGSGIGSYALYLNKKPVKGLVIPNTVTSISSGAFSACNSLTSVTIPNSVTSIGGCAFYDCKALKNINFPNSLTSIGEAAFAQSGLLKVVIPDSVTSIGERAFCGCAAVSIKISNSITEIAGQAFSCDFLRELTLPVSAEFKMGHYIFDDGFSAETSFWETTGIEKITLTKGKDGMMTNYRSPEDNSYKTDAVSASNTPWQISRDKLKVVVLQEGIQNIGAYAFDSCSALQTISIPVSVNEVGIGAFGKCTGLKDIYYSGSPAQWLVLRKSVGKGNAALLTARVHYYHNAKILAVFGCTARTAAAQKVEWNAVAGAAGYQVQISNAAGTKWAKYYNTAGTAFVFKNLAAGSNYKFRVRFVKYNAKGKAVFSAWKYLASPTLPKATSLAKLAGAKKSFGLSWYRQAVSGYQVQFSTNAKFTGARLLTIKNPKQYKALINKLSAKKVYYVRIRTYKTINKANYFSTWSKVYKVKTK